MYSKNEFNEEKSVMEDQKTYKLSRFFNIILNPQKQVILLIANALFVTALLLSVLNNKDTVWGALSTFVFVNVVLYIILLCHTPKVINLGEDYVNLYEYITLRPKRLTFTRVRGSFWWLRVNYSVSKIKNVNFHQSSFEKAFDVGRITFCGEAVFDAKRDMDRIPPKDSFTIYGVKNFSRVKSEFWISDTSRLNV